MHIGLFAILNWTTATTAFGADPCELPTDLALQAEQAVIEGRFEDMPVLVERFERSLSCAPAVDPGTLAAFLRAEGAWFHLTGLSQEAEFAFRSASELTPQVWTEAFGASVRAAFDSAAATPSPGNGSIQLEPPPADPNLQVFIDGTATALPMELNAGIHALQLIRSPESHGPEGRARFGSLIAVFPDEDIRVNPGVLPVEEPVTTLTTRPSRPWWLLAAAGSSLVASGVTAALALQQPEVANSAQSIHAVNQAEQRQRALAFASYGTFGAAAVAAGVYVAW